MLNQEQLPYLLRHSTIAFIEGDSLYIGNRQQYPFRTAKVRCDSLEEVIAAIQGMVTQGGGPLEVGLVTLLWLAQRAERGSFEASVSALERAALALRQARPTNTTLGRTLGALIDHLRERYEADQIPRSEIVSAVSEQVEEILERFDCSYDAMSDIGSQLLQDGDGVLTTCFAEHSLILSLLKAQQAGKEIEVFVSETRPYLQGARLMLPSLQELGIKCTLITDGMGAHALSTGRVTRYMTAADVVAQDGSIANKVGTLANAISSAYFKRPYHVFALSPDSSKKSQADFEIEYRAGTELLYINSQPLTTPNATGWYPSFDIVPPELISGIITPRGLFAPFQIKDYFTSEEQNGRV